MPQDYSVFGSHAEAVLRSVDADLGRLHGFVRAGPTDAVGLVRDSWGAWEVGSKCTRHFGTLIGLWETDDVSYTSLENT